MKLYLRPSDPWPRPGTPDMTHASPPLTRADGRDRHASSLSALYIFGRLGSPNARFLHISALTQRSPATE